MAETKRKKFAVTFMVEVESDTLPADEAEACAAVEDIVTDTWDTGRAAREGTDTPIVYDSHGFFVTYDSEVGDG